MVLSKRLQREWIKSELAAAQADREEQKRRQQQADEAHEAMVQIAREIRACEDGVSDPLAPEESLCVSIESILDRERQAEARGRQRDYDRWQESKPTWLNAPPASHPIPEQTPSARVGRLLDRPLTETEKLKIEAENRRRRLRGEERRAGGGPTLRGGSSYPAGHNSIDLMAPVRLLTGPGLIPPVATTSTIANAHGRWGSLGTSSPDTSASGPLVSV